jgi:hypothetical protein
MVKRLEGFDLTQVAFVCKPWFNSRMLKSKAIELLGGSPAAAAAAVGVSYQAVDKWPEELPQRIADRVVAALARKHLPPELIGGEALQGVQTGAVAAVVTPDRRISTKPHEFPDLDRRAVQGVA